MTPDQIVRDLRFADPALRRFATHLVPGRADEALQRAYSTAITQQIPVLEGTRPSVRMFWEVRASALALRTTSLASASTDDELATGLHALPANERAALLLVAVEGLSVANAASVLGVTPERVVDLSNGAARSLRERVPSVADVDDATLVGRVRDLPIVPAAPPFWDAVEREAMNAAAMAPPSRQVPTWVWVALGAVAVVVIAGLALLLSGGDDDDDEEIVAIATSTTEAVAPTTTGASTTTTVVATTTTEAPTTTVAPTTTAAPTTTTEPPDTGPVDRGEASFSDGAATLDGTLEGTADQWRLSVGDGESLVVPAGVPGVEVLVLDGNGDQVAPDGTAGALQVFDSVGDRIVELRPTGDDAVEYAVDLGRTSAGSGWLAVGPEEGSTEPVGELTALSTISCVVASERLDAELGYVDDEDQRVLVTFTNGTDTDTVAWTGPVEAGGAITSTSTTTNGDLFDGTFETGPDELVGRPFSVVVLGCEDG